jgi:lipoprotein-releasing system permease protein
LNGFQAQNRIFAKVQKICLALNFAWFVANRITFKSKRTFSKLIVRIAVLGITLGLGVMILSLAIVRGFKREIREKIRGFAGDMIVVKNDLNGSSENSPMVADPAFVKKAIADPLINRVMPFASKPGILKSDAEIEGIVLKGVDKTYDWSHFRANLVAGKIPDFSDSTAGKKELLISQYLADRLKLRVGDKVRIYFVQEPLLVRPFVITGIFAFGIDEIDKQYVVGDISIINRINYWNPDNIGGYEISVKNFDQLKAAEARIDDLLPENLKSYTLTENYPAIFAWLDLLDGNTNVVLVLMIIVAVINMISALLIMILERTTMIGILKALGATNSLIQEMFFYNALYLICLGMLLGNVFGIGIGLLQANTHILTLDPASYYMNFVPIQFNPSDLILVNIGTFVICVLVMIVPTTLVNKITPVRAIRFK